MTTIGTRLASLRELRGWTQEQMADYNGFARSQISQWECGQQPSVDNLRRLALTFACSVDWLLGAELPPREAQSTESTQPPTLPEEVRS